MLTDASACTAPAQQNRFGQRKIFGVSDLEILCTAGDQFGGHAQRFNGARFVGYSPTSRIERLHQQTDPKHLGGLRQPFVAAVQCATDTSLRFALERIREFVRQQSADAVMLASVDQLIDLSGRNQAAGSVVDQYPVLCPGTGATQHIEPMAHTGSAAGATAVGNLKQFFCNCFKISVARRHYDQRALQPLNP